MSLVFIGFFVAGISAAAAAALCVPKRKSEWPVNDKPRVKVTIKLGDK